MRKMRSCKATVASTSHTLANGCSSVPRIARVRMLLAGGEGGAQAIVVKRPAEDRARYI